MIFYSILGHLPIRAPPPDGESKEVAMYQLLLLVVLSIFLPSLTYANDCKWRPLPYAPPIAEGSMREGMTWERPPDQAPRAMVCGKLTKITKYLGQRELDWHVYLNVVDPIELHEQKQPGTVKKYSQIYGELMNLIEWEEGTFSFTFTSNDLSPVLQTTFVKSDWHDNVEQPSAIKGQTVCLQGPLVLDTGHDDGPCDAYLGSCGRLEIHPIESIAYRDNGGPGCQSPSCERYRVGVFTNSSIHDVHKCSFASTPRTVVWHFQGPKASPGFEATCTVTSVDNYLAGPVKCAPVAIQFGESGPGMLMNFRLEVPMEAPDKVGGSFMGWVDLRVEPATVSLTDPIVKDVAFVLANGGLCSGASPGAKGCRHRYGVTTEVSKVAGLVAPIYHWFVDGKPVVAEGNGSKLSFFHDVSPADGLVNYTPEVSVQAKSTGAGSISYASTTRPVMIPRPTLKVSAEPLKVSSKSGGLLQYEYTYVVEPQLTVPSQKKTKPMMPPHTYQWILESGGKTKLLGKSPLTKATAITTDYSPKLGVTVTGAYGAETATDSWYVHLPKLMVTLNASPGSSKQTSGVVSASVLGLPTSWKYVYHPVWAVKANASMREYDEPSMAPIQKPIKWQWNVIRGVRLLKSKSQTSGDVFTLELKEGLGINECVKVSAIATDALGQQAGNDVEICGGVTQKEVAKLLALVEEAKSQLKATLLELGKIELIKGPPVRLPPGPDPDPLSARVYYVQEADRLESMLTRLPLRPISYAEWDRVSNFFNGVTKIETGRAR